MYKVAWHDIYLIFNNTLANYPCINIVQNNKYKHQVIEEHQENRKSPWIRTAGSGNFKLQGHVIMNPPA